MAEGGEVPQDPSDLAAQVAHGESRRQAGIALANHRQQEELSRLDHPSLKSQHHVVAKGLLHTLKGQKSKIESTDKLKTMLDGVKEAHAHYSQNPEEKAPRATAERLGHFLARGDHEKAAEAINGHPLTGLVGQGPLESAIKHLSVPALAMESNPEAFRASVDYLANSERGASLLDKHSKGMTDKELKYELNPKHVEELKKTVDEYAANPQSMVDVGGSVSHYMPEETTQVAALAATAVSYLASLRPQNMQISPLDPVLPPSKAQVAKYDRQLAVAQNPAVIFNMVKNGSLLPEDVTTLQTIYPALHAKMVEKFTDQIIELKSKKKDVPYSMRASLSLVLGTPLDSTMTQSSMAAIMGSSRNAAPESQEQAQPKKPKPKAVSAVTAKTIETADKMSETPLQSRQINQNRK